MSKFINVKARINGGHHPLYGQIIAGKTYTIDPNHFGEQLFERPSKGWLAPWEQKSAATHKKEI